MAVLAPVSYTHLDVYKRQNIGVWSVDNPINFKSLELCYVWIDEAQAWDRFAYNHVIGRRRGTAQQRRLYPEMPLRTRITANPPHTLDHWLVDLLSLIHI